MIKLIGTIGKELYGLFIDDGSLVILLLALIAAAAALVKLLAVPGLLGGVVLLVGCLILLTESVFRASRRH